jgi:RNA polymerase sigma factor (sigma-70 family)
VSLATGTYLPVMDADTQSMIDAAMVKSGIQGGIGTLTRDDVRQHLQETALQAARRFDGSVKFTTFFYRRLNGECYQLIRNHGVRFRHSGRKRPVGVPLDERRNGAYYGGGDEAHPGAARSPAEFLEDEEREEDFVAANQMADLALALGKLPARLRTVLYLLYYEGLAEDAAADRLAISGDCLRELRDAGLSKMRLTLLGP